MVKIFLLLIGSSLVFLQLGLEMAAPHFDDAQLTDLPQAVVTRSLVGATGWQTDLCVARDNPVPDRS